MRLYARRAMCIAAVSISTVGLSLPVRGWDLPPPPPTPGYKCVANCGDEGGGGNSSPSYSPPREYEAERRAQEDAAAARQRNGANGNGQHTNGGSLAQSSPAAMVAQSGS